MKRRKSAKQASEARTEAKVRCEEYNLWFKIAFKEGTDLLLQQNACDKKNDSMSVDNIVAELNRKCHLVDGKKHSKSTLYRGVRLS